MKGVRAFLLVMVLAIFSLFLFVGTRTGAAAGSSTGSGPQYGGTITVLGTRSSAGPSSWDITDGQYQTIAYLAPFQDWLLTGDIHKYGPRGTNEFGFTSDTAIPPEFLKGSLAESWEVTNNPLGITFHIRHGVMWQEKPGVMKARELTAYDVEYALNRYRAAAPRGEQWIGYVKPGGFKALDKYTLQVQMDSFNSTWPFSFGHANFAPIYPPEMVKAGAADWKNQVGTGPFILTNYVKGVGATYEKNPNWWNKKLVIDGKEYGTPFIDKLVYLTIEDEATRMAALWTGRADWGMAIPLRYKSILSRTAPQLIQKEYLGTPVILLKFDETPGKLFANKDLRRAMMIGTDLQTMVKTVYGAGEVHTFPYSALLGPEIYTQLKDLPPETKMLFDYNPDLAKKMIKDAGYPNGFKITLTYSPQRPWSNDQVPLLKGMWAKIGVDVTLQPVDLAVHGGMEAKGGFGDLLLSGDQSVELAGWNLYRSRPYLFPYYDETLKKRIDEAFGSRDPHKANAIFKEMGIYVLNSVLYLPLGSPYNLVCWWPWVKNYYGEINANEWNVAPMAASMWIDKTLKAEMGK